MNLNKLILGLASVVVGFSSCEPIEEVGPRLCPSEDFNVTDGDIKLYSSGLVETELNDANKDVVLDSTGLHIYTDLGESVSWEIKISNGSQEKNYAGTGDEIDVFWYGTPDKFDGTNISFSEGEVTVEIDILCQETITKTVNVKGKQTFKNTHSTFGFLARDWDKNGVSAVRNDSYTFFDGAPFVSGNSSPDDRDFDYYDEFPSPSGGKYLQYQYYSGVGPTWYYGDYPIDIKGFQSNLSTSNTDSIYINVFVDRIDEHLNVPANFGMRDTSSLPEGFLVNEDINWDGWALLSYKLSDMRSTTNNAPLTDLGAMRYFLINFGASPVQSESTGCRYDMVLFTVGAPLFE